MNKKLVIGIVLLISAGLSGCVEEEIPLETKTTYVDDDNTEGPWNGTIECPYQYIQDGIDLADDGATVYVYSGTYIEELHISSKPVILQGENKETTIISGNSIGIFADDVKISGFTIKNSISIYSDNNIITDNIFISTDFDGIRLDGSLNNKILDNSFSSNGITIRTSGTPLFKFYNTHTIQNNYINGKPIYYYKNNHQGNVIPSDAGQVILVNCSNFTIENLNLTNSFYGIQLYYSSHNNIAKNTINNGERYGSGIYLFNSRHNQISENKLSYHHAGISIHKQSNYNLIKDNAFNGNCDGIYQSDSSDNRIINNTFFNSTFVSIYLDSCTIRNNVSNNYISNSRYGMILALVCDYNTIYRNDIQNNSQFGISIEWSANNIIFLNNFINNSVNAKVDSNKHNNWNVGQKGNYWDDYTGVDSNSDGIGDTSYPILEDGNVDNYPLINPIDI